MLEVVSLLIFKLMFDFESTFYIGGYFYDIGKLHRLLVAEARQRGRGVFYFVFTPQDLAEKPYFGGVGFTTLDGVTRNVTTPDSIKQGDEMMDVLEEYDTDNAYAVMVGNSQQMFGGGIIAFDDDERLKAVIDNLADYFKRRKKS